MPSHSEQLKARNVRDYHTREVARLQREIDEHADIIRVQEAILDDTVEPGTDIREAIKQVREMQRELEEDADESIDDYVDVTENFEGDFTEIPADEQDA